MDSITNYKISEFLHLDTDIIEIYMRYLRNLNPKSTSIELEQLKVKDIEYIKLNINSESEIFNIVALCEGIELKQVMELEILDFFPLLLHIQESLKTLIKRESNSLKSKHTDPRFEMVEGHKRLSKFGIKQTFFQITNNPLEWEKLENMKYIDFFIYLLISKENNEVSMDISKLKTTQY